MTVTTLVLLHCAATLFMVGLIWFVQVVHYPLFAAVGESSFAAYQLRHVRRTGWVVGPPMLLEATTAAALVLPAFQPEPVPPPWMGLSWALLVWAGLVLLAVVWGATAVVLVPCHRRLEEGFDAPTHRRLVAANWIRTAAWTLRGGVALTLATVLLI